MKLLVACLTLCLSAFLLLRNATSQEGTPRHVGQLPDGGFLLNSGWVLRPAGEQIPVDTLPMTTCLSHNGKYLLVLNAGYNQPSVVAIDLASKKEVSRVTLPDAWLGMTLTHQGSTIYVGGGTQAAVYQLKLDEQSGQLTRGRELSVVADIKSKGLSFVGDVLVSPDSRFLYAADLHTDTVAVLNTQSGELIKRWKVGRRPYRLLLSPDLKTLFVSSWADATVYGYDSSTGVEQSRTRVGAHPTDMAWLPKPPTTEGAESTPYNARLFVAAANTNNVYSLGLTAENQLKPLETINISLTPMQPLGMTPSSLAVDASRNQLYVACSDANAVAIVDVASTRSRPIGFIPTGWYPTSVRLLGEGQLVILNGKGLGSYPNPNGPSPLRRAAPLHQNTGSPAIQYVGSMQRGTAAVMPSPNASELDGYSRTVFQNTPYRDNLIYRQRATGGNEALFSKTPEHRSPIEHVIYIIKENRTYDQVLGDMEKGNGDKSLNLFKEEITPNLHRLARDYILYDNFYENADVSADGHNWAAAAIAPDYTVKLWPNSYGKRRKTYDYEGGEAANTPPAGYIWDNAAQAGVSFRDYGDWVVNLPLNAVNGSRQVAKVKDPVLEGHVDMNYRGFDLDYPDVDRAREFIREWQGFEGNSAGAPQLSVLRMGNDHTAGTAPGKLTPFAFAADNDYAIGLLVDAVSHSKLWPSTAIFIIEDDAQNGPDHVDSHRAPAWVISPFTRRNAVDSTMYNQTGILRTMELILGMRPLTHFDAAATPMLEGFLAQGDARPYSAIPPKTSRTEKNAGTAKGAAESARMDFSDADKADDDDLNEVLWRAIKRSEPPAPVRSAFASFAR